MAQLRQRLQRGAHPGVLLACKVGRLHLCPARIPLPLHCLQESVERVKGSWVNQTCVGMGMMAHTAARPDACGAAQGGGGAGSQAAPENVTPTVWP